MDDFKLWPGDRCPDCGAGCLYDPERESISLPPTGGDYEYCETNPLLICDKCGKEFRSKVKRRNWLDDQRVEYYLPDWEK